MNPQVKALFDQYLKLTGGDKAAAASLAVADLLATGRSQPAASRPLTVPELAKFPRLRRDKVLSWIRSGRPRGYNVAETENGRPKYRVNPEDVEAFTRLRMPFQPAPNGRPPGRRRRFPNNKMPTL